MSRGELQNDQTILFSIDNNFTSASENDQTSSSRSSINKQPPAISDQTLLLSNMNSESIRSNL